jgi:hypothetical protein
MNTDSIALLVTLKDRLEVNTTDTSEDGFLQSCLDWSTAKLQAIAGREFVQTTQTDYFSGDGGKHIFLTHGPVANVGSVSEVSYDGAGAESYSTLTQGVDYFVHGLRSERSRDRGVLERYGSTWLGGTPRNYRAVYQAGWDASTESTGLAYMPYDLIDACLHAAIWRREKRKNTAKDTRSVGSVSSPFRSEKELEDDLRMMISAYMSFGSE